MRSTILSALVVSVALVGDTFLYPVLPSHALTLGVPVMWVGFLLSVNRFTRLAINPWIGRLYMRHNSRKLMLIAAMLAVISTLLYGLAGGVTAWIVARLIWAISYSVLRLGAVYYALDAPKQGFGLGLNKGIQDLGPLLVMVGGPVLLTQVSVQTTFLVLSVITVIALPLAWRLPVLEIAASRAAPGFQFLPSPFNGLIFLVAFAVDGLLVVTLGSVVETDKLSAVEIASCVAFYLGIKRLLIILLSPLTGLLADRCGIRPVFLASVLLTATGLLAAVSGWGVPGALTTFIGAGIAMSLAPAENPDHPTERFRAVAATTNWRDSGAAFGALIGGMIYYTPWIEPLLLVLAVLVLLFGIRYRLTTKNRIFKSTPWK